MDIAPIKGGLTTGIIAMMWRNFLKGISVRDRVKANKYPRIEPPTAVSVPISTLFRNPCIRYLDFKTSRKTDKLYPPFVLKLVAITRIRGYRIKMMRLKRTPATTINSKGSLERKRISRRERETNDADILFLLAL